ncbi:hypothetical protein NEOCIP111885_00843 [Pseudoneobacillus rhizosphaerae]|uniref:Uncharacterized protein n=1 Tax=Pseudoneobacillus rhizosphaerae TaxID=2880968 RepID=A0A9C7G7H2_9BACI|nr:hypothetical protein NEOCIP111885_00843 [Pseudoneobacillus rhizosphaerae]
MFSYDIRLEEEEGLTLSDRSILIKKYKKEPGHNKSFISGRPLFFYQVSILTDWYSILIGFNPIYESTH